MEVVLEGVTKKYGDFTAVNNLSLTIKGGALHFLLGPSGCGKTTTLRMLAGLETLTSGKIFFDGKDVTNLPAADRGIGMVFQNYALWPHMTVEKNIAYGLKLRKLTAAEQKARMDEVLDVTQLRKFMHRLPGQLSGGQQQRVALARALAIRPKIILLDEPLSNLDAKLRLEMRDNICSVHRQTGITMVYVTHDQKEALSMGTEVSVMHAGDLIQSDTPRTLYHSPKSAFIANFIGETNLIDGVYKGKEGAHHLVESAIGPVFSDRDLPLPLEVGQDVMLSVRPETIVTQTNGAVNGVNSVSGTIQRVTYLGESEQFELLSEAGVMIRALSFGLEDTVNEGESVRWSLPSSQVLVLPKQHNMSSGT